MLDVKPLCTVVLDVAASQRVGQTSAGVRSIAALRGATVTGDRLRATLAGPAAADWILVTGAVARIDVRMTWQTDDGALIYVSYTGKLLLAREGGPVAVVSPNFETGDERYAWLNDLTAVGRGVVAPGQEGRSELTYHFYEIL